MALAIIKLTAYGALLWSGLHMLQQFETWWFMQNVNLIFHEAGHFIFIFFGQFLYVLGGTIMEAAVPLLVTIQFMRQQDWFSAACCCWWSMTAFLSIAIYASDAQERILPLITNDSNSHDWHWLLRETRLLAYDDVVGGVFWTLALVSLFVGLFLLSKDTDIRNLFRLNT